MAFNSQEQNIIKWGLDNGKTKDDVTRAISNYRLGIQTPKTAPQQTSQTPSRSMGQQPGVIQKGIKDTGADVADAISGQGQYQGENPIQRGFEASAKVASSPIKLGFDWLINQISDSPALQKAVLAHPKIAQAVEKTASYGTGQKELDWFANKVGDSPALQSAVINHPKTVKAVEDVSKVLKPAGEIASDILAYQGVADAGNTLKNNIAEPFKSNPDPTYFHGTTPENATAIRDKGFDLNKSRGGQTEPVAINLTNSEAEGLTYAKGNKAGLVQTTFKGKNVATFNSPAEYIEAVDKSVGTYSGPNASKFLSQYDGVIIKGGGANGADMLLTTNPKMLNTIGSSNAGSELIGSATSQAEGTIGVSPVKNTVKNIVNDVIPTTDRFINTEVTKALDLTQGDVKNISLSTGNDVGKFLADKNLIGNNLAETIKNIDAFYKENYNAVRSEIGKIKGTYTQEEIPRYTEALKALKQNIAETPGLQEANYQVKTLLANKNPTVADVQRVKELMDEHFSLYKATGDVKEGVAKEGLTNIRKDLREWIENEVKDKTGADVRDLNNNVQTARSISDAIETRSTRGLTRATISAGDVITFLTGSALATPVGGVIAVIAKKVYQSPSFKLKLTKWLDGISDASKAKVLENLKNGEVPPDLQALLDTKRNRA